MKITEQDLENLVHYIQVPNLNGNSKHILDRFLRRIHNLNEYELTEFAKNQLKDYGLYTSNKITQKNKTKLNRELKKQGFNDSLMIEHLYSIKNMIGDLVKLKEKFNGVINTQILHQYLEEKTYCVYKFKINEKELHG